MIKVLIVEDETQILRMYEFKLEKSGYSVRCSENGRDGLREAEDFRPDIILLDLMMPEMNGDEMLKILRSKDWGKNIRVIILTNISKDEAPSSLRLLNVDRYIVKAHFTPAQVIEIVDELMKVKAN